MPESGAVGAGFGIREFVNILSLETFVRVADDGHAVPGLVASWTWETDTRVRLHLRPKVLFHDGSSLDAALAAPVVRTAVTNPANRALMPALNDILSVEPDGELDLVLTLARPSPLLLEDLVFFFGKDSNVGTGPYRVVKTEPKQLTLERFDSYHQGKPTVAQIVVQPFDTLRNAWASLLRGDVDVVTDVPADAVEFIRNDDVQVIPYARRYQYLIAFNSRRGALRAPAVRRALNLAVDRASLIERVLQRAGTPSAGPLWPSYWAYDPAIQPYAASPEQAAALLDDAGYRVRRQAGAGPPSRFRFTCLIPENFSVYERLALEVQKSLLNIGVDMRIQPVPPAEFNKHIVSGDFDAVLNDMVSGPTPARASVFWLSRRAFQGTYNVFGYDNAEADKLFGVITSSTNDAAVRSATVRLQQVMLNDPPALFLAWNARARAIRSDFATPQVAGDPLSGLWKWTRVPVDATR